MYLNVVQVAESFGVEESVIRSWVRDEGMPHVPERGRLLFDRAQVAAWAVERGLAAKVGFLAPEASARGAASGASRPCSGPAASGATCEAAAILGVLETVVARLPGATPNVRQLLAQRVRAPGGVIWAPVGNGLALPHLRSPVALGRDSGVLAMLFLREPLAMDEPAPDGVPVTRLLFFVAPSPRAHLELLARLSAALQQGELRRQVLEAASDEAIFAALAAGRGRACGHAREGGSRVSPGAPAGGRRGRDLSRAWPRRGARRACGWSRRWPARWPRWPPRSRGSLPAAPGNGARRSRSAASRCTCGSTA